MIVASEVAEGPPRAVRDTAKKYRTRLMANFPKSAKTRKAERFAGFGFFALHDAFWALFFPASGHPPHACSGAWARLPAIKITVMRMNAMRASKGIVMTPNQSR